MQTSYTDTHMDDHTSMTVANAGSSTGPGTRSSRRSNTRKRFRAVSDGEEECYDIDCSLPIASEEDVVRCQGPSCTNVVCSRISFTPILVADGPCSPISIILSVLVYSPGLKRLSSVMMIVDITQVTGSAKGSVDDWYSSPNRAISLTAWPDATLNDYLNQF